MGEGVTNPIRGAESISSECPRTDGISTYLQVLLLLTLSCVVALKWTSSRRRKRDQRPGVGDDLTERPSDDRKSNSRDSSLTEPGLPSVLKRSIAKYCDRGHSEIHQNEQQDIDYAECDHSPNSKSSGILSCVSCKGIQSDDHSQNSGHSSSCGCCESQFSESDWSTLGEDNPIRESFSALVSVQSSDHRLQLPPGFTLEVLRGSFSVCYKKKRTCTLKQPKCDHNSSNVTCDSQASFPRRIYQSANLECTLRARKYEKPGEISSVLKICLPTLCYIRHAKTLKVPCVPSRFIDLHANTDTDRKFTHESVCSCIDLELLFQSWECVINENLISLIIKADNTRQRFSSQFTSEDLIQVCQHVLKNHVQFHSCHYQHLLSTISLVIIVKCNSDDWKKVKMDSSGSMNPDSPGDSFFTWDSGGGSGEYSFVHTAVELPKYPDGAITEEERQMLLLYMRSGHPELLLPTSGASSVVEQMSIPESNLCDSRGFLETIVEENSDDLRSPSEADETSLGWGSWDESDDDRVTVVEMKTQEEGVKREQGHKRNRSDSFDMPNPTRLRKESFESEADELSLSSLSSFDVDFNNESPQSNVISAIKVSDGVTELQSMNDVFLVSSGDTAMSCASNCENKALDTQNGNSFNQVSDDPNLFPVHRENFDALWISATKVESPLETVNPWCDVKVDHSKTETVNKADSKSDTTQMPTNLVDIDSQILFEEGENQLCLIPARNQSDPNPKQDELFSDDFKDYFLPAETYIPNFSGRLDPVSPDDNVLQVETAPACLPMSSRSNQVRCFRIGFESDPNPGEGGEAEEITVKEVEIKMNSEPVSTEMELQEKLDIQETVFAPREGDVVYGSSWFDNPAVLKEQEKAVSGAETVTIPTDACRTTMKAESPPPHNDRRSNALLNQSMSDEDILDTPLSLSRWQHHTDLQRVQEATSPLTRWQHQLHLSGADETEDKPMSDEDNGLPPQLKQIYSSFKMKDKKMSRIRIKEDKNNNFKTIGLWDNETKVTLPPFSSPASTSTSQNGISNGDREEDLDDLELEMFAVGVNGKTTTPRQGRLPSTSENEIDNALKSFNHLDEYSSNSDSDEQPSSFAIAAPDEHLDDFKVNSNSTAIHSMKHNDAEENENADSDNSDNCPLCTDAKFNGSNVLFSKAITEDVKTLLMNTYPKVINEPQKNNTPNGLSAQPVTDSLSPITSSDSDEGIIALKEAKKRPKKRLKENSNIEMKHDDSGYVEDDEDDDEDDILEEKEHLKVKHTHQLESEVASGTVRKSLTAAFYSSKNNTPDQSAKYAIPQSFEEFSSKLEKSQDLPREEAKPEKTLEKWDIPENLSQFSAWLLDKELKKISNRGEMEALIVNDLISLREQTITQFLNNSNKKRETQNLPFALKNGKPHESVTIENEEKEKSILKQDHSDMNISEGVTLDTDLNNFNEINTKACGLLTHNVLQNSDSMTELKESNPEVQQFSPSFELSEESTSDENDSAGKQHHSAEELGDEYYNYNYNSNVSKVFDDSENTKKFENEVKYSRSYNASVQSENVDVINKVSSSNEDTSSLVALEDHLDAEPQSITNERRDDDCHGNEQKNVESIASGAHALLQDCMDNGEPDRNVISSSAISQCLHIMNEEEEAVPPIFQGTDSIKANNMATCDLSPEENNSDIIAIHDPGSISNEVDSQILEAEDVGTDYSKAPVEQDSDERDVCSDAQNVAPSTERSSNGGEHAAGSETPTDDLMTLEIQGGVRAQSADDVAVSPPQSGVGCEVEETHVQVAFEAEPSEASVVDDQQDFTDTPLSNRPCLLSELVISGIHSYGGRAEAEVTVRDTTTACDAEQDIFDSSLRCDTSDSPRCGVADATRVLDINESRGKDLIDPIFEDRIHNEPGEVENVSVVSGIACDSNNVIDNTENLISFAKPDLISSCLISTYTNSTEIESQLDLESKQISNSTEYSDEDELIITYKGLDKSRSRSLKESTAPEVTPITTVFKALDNVSILQTDTNSLGSLGKTCDNIFEELKQQVEHKRSRSIGRDLISTEKSDKTAARSEYQRSRSVGPDSKETDDALEDWSSQSKSTPDLRRCIDETPFCTSSAPLSVLLSKSVSQRIQDYLGSSARGGFLNRSLPPNERSRHYRRICVSTETVVERAARFEGKGKKRSEFTSASPLSSSTLSRSGYAGMGGVTQNPAWGALPPSRYNKPTATVRPHVDSSYLSRDYLKSGYQLERKPQKDMMEIVTGYSKATKAVCHKPPLPPSTDHHPNIKSACIRGRIASARKDFFEKLSSSQDVLKKGNEGDRDGQSGLDRFDHFRRSARDERARLAASHPDLGALEAAVRSSKRKIDQLKKSGSKEEGRVDDRMPSTSEQDLSVCLPYRRCTGEIAWASCSKRLMEAKAKRKPLADAQVIDFATGDDSRAYLFKRPADELRAHPLRGRGDADDRRPPCEGADAGGAAAIAAVEFLGTRARSMDFLLDADNRDLARPPENRLQGRVKSEHELRVERSLQNLSVPEWYRQSSWSKKSKEGFILRRGSEGSSGESRQRWRGLGSSSRTPSATSLTPAPHGARSIVVPRRVVPPGGEWRSLVSSRESLASPASLSPRECAAAAFQYGINASLSRWSSSRLSTSSAPATAWNTQRSLRQPYLGWRAAAAASSGAPSSGGPSPGTTPLHGSRPASPRRGSQEHHPHIAAYLSNQNQMTCASTLRPEGESADNSRISPLALYDNATNVFFNSNADAPQSLEQSPCADNANLYEQRYNPAEMRRDRYSYTQSLYSGTVIMSPGTEDDRRNYNLDHQTRIIAAPLLEQDDHLAPHTVDERFSLVRSPQPPPRVWMESSFVGTKKNGEGQQPYGRSIRIVPSDAAKFVTNSNAPSSSSSSSVRNPAGAGPTCATQTTMETRELIDHLHNFLRGLQSRDQLIQPSSNSAFTPVSSSSTTNSGFHQQAPPLHNGQTRRSASNQNLDEDNPLLVDYDSEPKAYPRSSWRHSSSSSKDLSPENSSTDNELWMSVREDFGQRGKVFARVHPEPGEGSSRSSVSPPSPPQRYQQKRASEDSTGSRPIFFASSRRGSKGSNEAKSDQATSSQQQAYPPQQSQQDSRKSSSTEESGYNRRDSKSGSGSLKDSRTTPDTSTASRDKDSLEKSSASMEEVLDSLLAIPISNSRSSSPTSPRRSKGPAWQSTSRSQGTSESVRPPYFNPRDDSGGSDFERRTFVEDEEMCRDRPRLSSPHGDDYQAHQSEEALSPGEQGKAMAEDYSYFLPRSAPFTTFRSSSANAAELQLSSPLEDQVHGSSFCCHSSSASPVEGDLQSQTSLEVLVPEGEEQDLSSIAEDEVKPFEPSPPTTPPPPREQSQRPPLQRQSTLQSVSDVVVRQPEESASCINLFAGLEPGTYSRGLATEGSLSRRHSLCLVLLHLPCMFCARALVPPPPPPPNLYSTTTFSTFSRGVSEPSIVCSAEGRLCCHDGLYPVPQTDQSILPSGRATTTTTKSPVTTTTSTTEDRPRAKRSSNLQKGETGDTHLKCHRPKCSKSLPTEEARAKFRTCPNCYTYYCSRQCRKLHLPRHRDQCPQTRISNLCKQVLMKARDDPVSRRHLSLCAKRGLLSRGRGAVKLLFLSPEDAMDYLDHGWENAKSQQTLYVSRSDLLPQEMGPDVFSQVRNFCDKYNPERKFILLAAITVTNEVASPNIECEVVVRGAKMHLSPSLPEDDVQTLILTITKAAGDSPPQTTPEDRQSGLGVVMEQLNARGVELDKQYPDTYRKILRFVEENEPFTPISIFPMDQRSGRVFMCIILPWADADIIVNISSKSGPGKSSRKRWNF